MASIETLEQKRKKAHQLFDEIKEIRKSLDIIHKQASEISGSINTKDKSLEKLNTELKSIKQTTQSEIRKFNSEKNKITKMLNDVETFYNTSFLPAKKKVVDKRQGLNALVLNGVKDNDKLKTIISKCETQYSLIIQAVKDYSVELKNFSRLSQSISRYHDSSLNNRNKIGELLNLCKEANNQIQKHQTYIDKLKSKCDILHTEINSIKAKSQTSLSEIESIQEQSEEKLREIRKIYDISHETGLSGEFEKRRNKLSRELRRWEVFIFATSLFLLACVVGLFILQLYLYDWDITAQTFDVNFYIRFLILSPIVYYLYFVSTEYNKAKKLHDKYAFKTTLSMSIKQHIELLTQNGYFTCDNYSERVLNFIIEGFEKIYCEPYDVNDYKMKIKLADIEIDMQKRIIEKLSSLGVGKEIISQEIIKS